jgi:hypothetical protein|tara:strand:- start:180 stop:3173 length:2994 start_codon:yes stop_codon:yes gene_type:complete
MADEGEDKGVSKDMAAAIGKAARSSEALAKMLKTGKVSMSELVGFATSYQSTMQKTDITTGKVMANIYAMNSALGKSKMEADKVQGFMVSSANAASNLSEKVSKLAKTESQRAFFNERLEAITYNQKDILEQMATAQGGLLKLEVARETSLRGAFLSQAAEYRLMVSKGAMTEKDYKKQIQSLKQQQDKTTELEDQLAMEEAIAQEILDIKANTESWGKSLQKTAATAKAIASDPAVFGALVLNKVVKTAKEAYNGFEDLRESGMSAGQALEGSMKSFSINSMIGISDTKGAVQGLTEEFGTINNVSAETLDNIGSVAHEMGISGTEAAKLTAQMSQMTGESTAIATETLNYTNELARANGIAPGKLTKAMASNTKDMYKFTKGGSKEFAKIAVEAQKIGIDMETAANAASGLLDFESSIEAQMEASVMLGKEINLDKARQLALDGKSLEAAKEAVKQMGGMAEFSKMNVLEQEIAAKAAGMALPDLLKAMDAEENKGKYAAENASQASEAAGGAIELAAKLGGVISNNAMLLMSMVQFMASGNAMTAAHWVKEKAHMLWKKVTGKSIIDQSTEGGSKAGDSLKKGMKSDVETKVPGSDDVAPSGEGSEGGLKSLAEGLKAMGDGKVFAGIGAVALAGPAFIVALPSIPFLLFMGKVKLKALEENFTGLATGLSSMSGTLMGSVALAAFGLAGGAAVLAIPFIVAIALGGRAAGAGLSGLATGLAALGTAAIPLGFIGVGLIAALGVAMIPFAFALSLVTPLIEAFGNIIIGVLAAVPPIIEAIANGFVTMLSAITPEAIVGLMLLGPAFGLAAIGMLAFAASLGVMAFAAIFGAPALVALGLGMMVLGAGVTFAAGGLDLIARIMPTIDQAFVGVSASITSIVTLLPAMLMMGTALFSMAAGLAAFAVAGVFTLPTIMGLIALSLVAPVLTALGDSINFDLGGGSSVESREDSKMDALIGEVRSLKAAFETPGVVNMDGKKVGDALRLSITNSNVK